jgi:O-acetyl-ADP-ribose deacetylase (regulator of RNase III)
MTPAIELLDELIRYLIEEDPTLTNATLVIPDDVDEKKRLFRALMNIRPPQPATALFYQQQDRYLKAQIEQAGITDAVTLPRIASKNYLTLWQGDITTLKVDAIVNAANQQMLGCFHPNHRCIDNAIHSFAGIQLREACHFLMTTQGRPEKVGGAKITPGFNLPARHIIHTVGPTIHSAVTELDIELLKQSYISCMQLAERRQLNHIAFCCISTGEFHFPAQLAAEIAVETVVSFMESQAQSLKQVIFNVFTDRDKSIYERILAAH